MKIVLATGIYPPDIGGPATYVRNLARELAARGQQVTVVTYVPSSGRVPPANDDEPWTVVHVPRAKTPIGRWSKYAKALRLHAQAADVVECFSSVSAGVPLKMAKLRLPKKVLRLGGDFAWERYTDLGGRKTLRAFTASYPRLRAPMDRLLGSFDHVVFSTRFQEQLCKAGYRRLRAHSVIENALPERKIHRHEQHDPFRLLYFGRFVRFKNLDRLLRAVALIPHVTLTIVGEGPLGGKLSAQARALQLQGRVSIVPAVKGENAESIFAEHDLLVIPSITEISPNSALEARASGLPVLLSEENGLSQELRDGMIVRPTQTTTEITRAILEVEHNYAPAAAAAAAPFPRRRGWAEVAEEHLTLFRGITGKS